MESLINKIMRYITIGAAVVFIFLGAAIMMGYLISPSLPSQFRWMVGIVLFLYGIFRIIYTINKKRESDE